MKQNTYDSEKITKREEKKSILFCVHIRKMYLKKVFIEKNQVTKNMQTFPELKFT